MTELGGVFYNAKNVKEAVKLNDGNFKITLKSGESIIYPQQTGARDRRIEYHQCDDTSYIRIWDLDDCSITGSKDLAMRLRLEGGKNINIDASLNNKKDDIDVSCSENVTVKADDKDWMHNRIVKYDTDLPSEDCIVDFHCGKKAGTYELKVPDIFIKREDVPDVLLKAYDEIAKKANNKKYIDSNAEVLSFNSKVQEAFNNQKITKKEAMKMGYEAHSTYDYEKWGTKCGGVFLKGAEYVEKHYDQKEHSEITNACVGIATTIGAVGGYMVAGMIGFVGDLLIRTPYNYVSGEMDKQVEFTHWKTSGNYSPEPKN